MNKKKIIVLLICVVALLGVLIYVVNLPDKEAKIADNGGQTSTDTQIVEETPIYTATYDSINSITLYYDSETYVFSKNGMDWICDSHPDETFNISRIGALATRISVISATDTLSGDTVNPEDCGIDLQKPAISFESDLGTVLLYKGSATAESDGNYIMTSLSSDVYIVTSQTYNMIFEDSTSYKNTKIRTIDYENITAIEFKNELCAMSLRLENADMKQGLIYAWRIVSPINIMARDTEIKARLINPVATVGERMFVSDKGDFENYGFGDKGNYAVLIDKNGESQIVYFGSDVGGKCYMSIDDSKYIYEAGDASQTYSNINLIDIASRYLYINQQENIEEVVVSGDGINYTLDFADTPIIRVNGNELTNGDDRNEVFYAVCSVFADDINTEPAGKTAITFTYKLKDGKIVVVTLSEKDARYWKAAIDGKPTYVVLKSKIDSSLETLKKFAK